MGPANKPLIVERFSRILLVAENFVFAKSRARGNSVLHENVVTLFGIPAKKKNNNNCEGVPKEGIIDSSA